MKRLISFLIVVVLAAILLPLDTVNAASYEQVAKLTAGADGIPYAYFGVAVSISGDTMVIGAVWDDDNGTHSGSAYVFERNQDGLDNWGNVTKLTASDGDANDHFGAVVSISGDTIVVGAPFDDVNGTTDAGSAYVFTRNQGGVADSWGQVKKLTAAADGAAGDLFGYAVSISAETIVVGAFEDDDNGADSGSAYVFERNWGGTADNWGQVKKLTAGADGAAGDYFGWAVSISGDTIVVGAYMDDDNGTADSGSAYVFTRNQGGVADSWGQVKKLTAAADGAAGDLLGYAVSISGDTIVVGAYRDDDNGTADSGSAYVFERNHDGADNWGEVKKLTAGADGAAGDFFGYAVSISGDTIVVGAYGDDDNGTDSGSAYAFERNHDGTADNWGEVKKLTAADAAAGDWFGSAVSISGDTIAVGAPFDDDHGETSGSAYTYVICSTPDWEQLKKNIGDDGDVDDYFGQAVSISGDTMVVGAEYDDDKGENSGSAYVFERNWNGTADNWGLVKKLTATDGAAGDYFGAAVSISGDTIVVGAYYDDDTTDSGSAYVFERNKDGPDNWGQVKKLTASDGAAYDYFGTAVSISGDTVVVGAFEDDDNGKADSGSAYVFERNQGGTANNWSQVKKLTASDGAEYDYFGRAVSISDDTIVVGAHYDDDNGSSSGSAYVFERNWGGTANNWSQVKKLTASDAAEYDYFGLAVSISGDTIVAGAFLGNLSDIDSGSAYVFERNWGGVADNWGQVKKLTASDAASGDYFGYTVCISTDTIVVGAPYRYGPPLGSGSAYVFERNQVGIADNWGEVKKLVASDAASSDYFGWAVSISGDTIVVGAHGDDDNGESSGSAYLFHIVCGMQQPTLILDPSSDTNPVGTSRTVTATYELDEVPQEGVQIDFFVTDGPNAGDGGSNTTDISGQASFTYTGDGGVGTDTINATAFDQAGAPVISAQATKEWTGTPNMSFTKTVELVGDVNGNGEANPGDTIKYTAHITNVGNAPATNVTFLDTPDINTALVVGNVTTTDGSVVEGNAMGDVSVEVDIENIPAGNSVIITFEVTVNNAPKADTVTNQGLIEGDNIPSTLSDDPSTDTPGDPTILRIHLPPAQSVPGVSFWGNVALALLIAGAMVWSVRRRHVSAEAR
jgi:uncharacterized repeat protein (TIGR01451 family)